MIGPIAPSPQGRRNGGMHMCALLLQASAVGPLICKREQAYNTSILPVRIQAYVPFTGMYREIIRGNTRLAELPNRRFARQILSAAAAADHRPKKSPESAC